MDEQRWQRLADCTERGAADFATEVCAVRDDLGKFSERAELLAHDRDWYYDPAAQNLYVWSAVGNPVTHYGSVSPIILERAGADQHR